MKVVIALAIGLLERFVVVVAQKCSGDQFTCDNGNCIPSANQCDGDNDCFDFSDEIDCYCPGYSCNGTGLCIPNLWLCDNFVDCPQGDDEGDQCPPCYQCKDSTQCIPGGWVCDQYSDCPNEDDEIDCPCNDGEVRCESGQCIKEIYWCDGEVLDCFDGSDESETSCGSSDVTIPTVRRPLKLSREAKEAKRYFNKMNQCNQKK